MSESCYKCKGMAPGTLVEVQDEAMGLTRYYKFKCSCGAKWTRLGAPPVKKVE